MLRAETTTVKSEAIFAPRRASSIAPDERPIAQLGDRLFAALPAVFITIGPYQATGSAIGLPETRQKT